MFSEPGSAAPDDDTAVDSKTVGALEPYEGSSDFDLAVAETVSEHSVFPRMTVLVTTLVCCAVRGQL